MSWLSDEHLELIRSFSEYLNNPELSEDKFSERIFGMFQVDLAREIQNQFAFLKHSNLQPSEIKDMFYWEWEMMLKELSEYMEKEKEQQEEQQEQQKGNYKNTREYQDAQKMMGGGSSSYGNIPKMGSMPSFNMPKF